MCPQTDEQYQLPKLLAPEEYSPHYHPTSKNHTIPLTHDHTLTLETIGDPPSYNLHRKASSTQPANILSTVEKASESGYEEINAHSHSGVTCQKLRDTSDRDDTDEGNNDRDNITVDARSKKTTDTTLQCNVMHENEKHWAHREGHSSRSDRIEVAEMSKSEENSQDDDDDCDLVTDVSTMGGGDYSSGCDDDKDWDYVTDDESCESDSYSDNG